MYAEARLARPPPLRRPSHLQRVLLRVRIHPEQGDREDAGHRGEVMRRQARVLGVGLDLAYARWR